MPRLAIVISAVDNIDLLEGTLVSVLENRPADCEIIAALNQPYSDPYDLKDEVRFVQAIGRVSAVAAINQALTAARAPFVHLLASGCEVTEGWADEALSRFGDRQIGSVAPLVFDAQKRDRIFAAGVGYRRGGKRYLVGRGLSEVTADAEASILGPGGFAAFYRKAALNFVGGLSTQLGQPQADVDLALVLKHAGFAVALEPRSRIYASAEVDPAEGAWRQALHDERLFWRNLPAAGIGAMGAHAGVVAFELLHSFARPRMLAQLAGRMLACSQIGGYARHHHALKQLGRRALRPKALHEPMRIDRPHKAPTHSEPARAQLHSR